MPLYYCSFVSFVFSILSCVASAQSIEPIKGSFREGFSSATNLSGSLVVAVMYGSSRFPSKDAMIRILHGSLPRGGGVVITVRTTDGLYVGTARYSVPEKTVGSQYLLTFPSKEALRLAGYNADEVLCLVEWEDSTGSAPRYLPGSWGTATDGPVTISLNSGFRSDGGNLVVARLEGDNSQKKLELRRISTSRVHDTELSLSRSKESSVTTLTAVRSIFGRLQDSATFTVTVP